MVSRVPTFNLLFGVYVLLVVCLLDTHRAGHSLYCKYLKVVKFTMTSMATVVVNIPFNNKHTSAGCNVFFFTVGIINLVGNFGR